MGISSDVLIGDYVEDTQDEPTTLEKDLEETIDKLFHKDMAQVQIILQKKRVQFFKALEAWAVQENEKKPGHLEFFKQQANQHMHKYDQDILWERNQQQRRLEYLKLCRMNELHNFLQANGH